LLRHTTGLTAHAYDDLVEQKIPLAQIMESLPLANIVSSPGQLYAYQNVMFSFYDTIVAAKTGKNYSDMLNEKIFGPFSMNDASTGFSAFKDNNNKALPHTGSDKYFRVTSLNDRYYNTLPAAGVNASISDMANFLLALLNDSLGSWNKNVEEMIFTPQIESILTRSYFRQWDPVESKEYGIGWRLVGYKGRKVAYHGGFVKGYRAEVALCKEENAGIVFLCNSPCSIAAKAVPMFLNPLFELKDNQKLANDPHKTANPPNKS
jgi:beta-lactamase class C